MRYIKKKTAPRQKKFVQKWTKGHLLDEMELEIRWQKEYRNIDGDTVKAGFAYSFNTLNSRHYGCKAFPTMLKAITAAALSYCSAREHNDWCEWRDSQVWSLKKTKNGNTISVELSADGPKPI